MPVFPILPGIFPAFQEDAPAAAPICYDAGHDSSGWRACRGLQNDMSGVEKNWVNQRSNAVSLRLLLILLVALVLVASLAVGGVLATYNASRSVETEMRSAVAVATQMVTTGINLLATSDDPVHDLEYLVDSFKGNRHVRVSLTGDNAAVANPPIEAAPVGDVPRWFVRLLDVPATKVGIPVSVYGRNFGTIVIETDPHNEILEIWDEFGESLLLLGLFSGPTILLIYLFVGRALRPLARLAEALRKVGAGDYGVRLSERLPPELAGLRDSFNRMAGQLSAMASENRRLNEQLLTLQEEERNDIARDLHDEIGPFLFAINVDAANIARHIDENRTAPVRGLVQSIVEAVGHMQRQVRSMLGQLRPIGLADFGLAEAIENLIDFWRRRYPGISYEFEMLSESESFGELIDATIYRIVQEALSNAVRHGQPTAITVTLELRRQAAGEPAAVVATVADDGRGMAGSPGTGYGLLGMGERVKALGGALAVASRPGEGTTVTATIPFPAAGQPAPLAESALS